MNDTEFTVRKIGYTVPVSCCVLGTCTHPAPPPLPLSKRIRYRVSGWWYSNRPRIHRGPCNHDDCC